MINIESQIIDDARGLFDYTRGLRRDFHRNPEIGYEELRTSGIIAEELKLLGFPVQTKINKTGVMATLTGNYPGKVVLLRFDMDALPIEEQNQVEYKSIRHGVMHACGHDGHMAIGLTAARILNKYKNDIHGTIKFIFQPAEEVAEGASGMIDEGVLENLKVDYVLGCHLWNDKPAGWAAVVPGPVMAGVDNFRVVIEGKGGHGGIPHQTVDPVYVSAQIISALQSIVSRNISPLQSSVVSVTRIRGGDAYNVIPSTCEFCGTIRTFEKVVRTEVLKRFKEIVNGICEAMKCSAEIEMTSLAIPVVNDPITAQRILKVAEKLFSPDKIDQNFRTMGAEDFAYFLEKVPGCFIFVGSANEEKGLNQGHHHPRFDFDEDVLPAASALMAMSAWELLK